VRLLLVAYVVETSHLVDDMEGINIGYRACCVKHTLFHYSMVERKYIVGFNKLSSVLFEGSETVANTGQRCRSGQGLGIQAGQCRLYSLYHGLEDGEFWRVNSMLEILKTVEGVNR
jgi:hypothetical protein